jgi:hypothetical protein
MGRRLSLHHLENIDLKQRTAICSICGPTSIYALRNSKHPHRRPSIYCINRYREIVRDCQRRRREQAQAQNPNWKPKHKLSEIDLQKMRGICAICGPTDILKAATYQNRTLYRCATNIRKQARDYSRLHYKPTPKPR